MQEFVDYPGTGCIRITIRFSQPKMRWDHRFEITGVKLRAGLLNH